MCYATDLSTFLVLVFQTISTSVGSKSRQSKVEELGGILDKMRVQSKTKESNLGEFLVSATAFS